ncbi:MAG: hypothetical protein ACR2J1_03850 [Methyloceanibacter sp.]|uniref:hypothetical protein n=1 Tax=Methyloceanibacter sp. TaxID=1965321 RepID=UPI003D9B5D42
MLTRALFVFLSVVLAAPDLQAAPLSGVGGAGTAGAAGPYLITMGITQKEVTPEELESDAGLPAPKFNTGAIAYVLASNLKKGDTVEVTLNNGDTPLLRNTETLAEDKAKFLLQAGKRGVPAGGWPEGTYLASVKITRDGKTVMEEKTEPMAFE